MQGTPFRYSVLDAADQAGFVGVCSERFGVTTEFGVAKEFRG